MAGKNTISITFKLDGDNKGFKELAKDAGGLKQVMTATISEADRLKKSAVNFAAVATGINAARDSLVALTAVVKDLSDANAVQVMAETRLETVMRQRMNATDAEVQAIKDLASAQQALGVIGDEVQLSGAQQLATFLNQKSSLDVLLPAMNNLVAQQKGINATTQDAVNVGNLMGKAMQGQVGALTRVGITFDEAEAKVLKYGTEEERAAMLAQVITNNVGHMNEAIAATDVGKQQQLVNTLGDYKEVVGQIATKVLPFLTVASQAGIAVSGVATLVSGLHSLKGVMTATAIKTKAVAAGMAMLGLKADKAAAVSRVFSAAMRGAAYQTTALKLALRGLASATVVGAALTAISIALEHLLGGAEGSAEAMEELDSATEAYRTTAADAQVKIDREVEALRDLIESNKDASVEVKRLNAEYGSIFGQYQTASAWYDTLTTKSKLYVQQLGFEAEAHEVARQLAQTQIDKQLTSDKMAAMREAGTDKETYKSLDSVWGNNGQKTLKLVEKTRNTEAYDALVSDWNKLDATEKSLNTRMGVVNKNLNNIAGQMAAVAEGSAATTSVVEVSAMTWAEVSEAINATNKELKETTDPKRIKELRDYNAQLEKRKEILDKTLGFNKTGATTTDTTTTTVEAPAVGLIGQLEEKLADARKRLAEATSEAAIEAINKEIEAYEGELEQYRKLGKEVAEAVEVGVEDNGPIWKADASTLQDISGNIQILNDQLQTASLEEAAAINQQISAWNDKAEAIRNAGKVAEQVSRDTTQVINVQWGAMKQISSSIQDITEALKGNGSAWQVIVGIVDSFISLYSGIETVIGVIKMLTGATTAHAAAKGIEAGAETTAAAARTSTAAVTAATSTAVISANKLEAASWRELAASEYMAAHAAIPFVGFALGAGFTAAMQAVTAAASIPMLADGGIASGPTLAMVGEYSGAGGNPEVIAPLDKLRGMLRQDSFDFSQVEFKIDGRQLVGILKKENAISKRS